MKKLYSVLGMVPLISVYNGTDENRWNEISEETLAEKKDIDILSITVCRSSLRAMNPTKERYHR